MVLGNSRVSPGLTGGRGALRDITSRDSLLRPVLSLGNKEEVAVLLTIEKDKWKVKPRACVTLEGCLTHCILGYPTQDGAHREK